MPQAAGSGVGTGCEVKDIEHSAGPEEGPSEEKRAVGLGAWLLPNMWSLISSLTASAIGCGVSELAFDLGRCLRNHKTANPVFAES